uniref:Protein PF14_0175-like n=1 Tax=Diabrotica virgifera virgifera TaxID=50390 RepID=A0A6P7GGT1_DIAVI
MARLGRRISVDGVPTVANTRRISVDDVPNVSNITAVKKPPKRQPQKISRRRQTIHELHNSAECHSIGQIHVPNQNQIPNGNNTKYLGWPNQNSINSDSRLGHLSYPNRNETVIANKGNTGRSWQNQNQISNGMTNNIGHNDNMNAKSTGYMPWPSQKQIPQNPNQISGVTFQGYRPVHYQHKNQIINNRSLNMGQVPNSHPPTTLHNQNYPSRNPVYGLNHQRGPQLHPYNFSASQDGLPFPPPYVPPISISNQRIPQYHQNPMINSVNGQYERSFQRSTVPNDIIQINNNQTASATNMQVLNNISIDNPIINNVNGQYERTATGFKRGTVLTDTVNMKNNQPTSANIQVLHNISVQDPHINSVNGQYQRSFQRHTVPTDTNNLKKYQTASAKNMPVLHNISVQDPVINNVNDLHERSFQRVTVPNDITRIKNNQITSATNMQVLHNISVQDPHINSVNGQYQRSFQRHTVPTDTNNLKKYQTAGAKNMPVLHNISVQDPVINNLNGLHERSFHRGTVPNDITHIKNNKTTSATNMQVLHNISVQDPHINSVNGQYQRSFQRHTVPTDTNNIKNYQTASDKNMSVLHNIFVQDPVINNVNDLQERSFQRGTIPNDISHIKNNQTTSATNMQVLHNISVQDPVINSVNGQYQRSFQSGTVTTDIINIKNNRTASAGDNIFQANESSNSADARKVKDFESTATDDSRTQLVPNAGIGASDQDTKNGLIGNHLPIDTTTTNRNDSKTSNSIVDRMLISDQSMEVTVTELTKNSTDDLHESADVKNVEISKEPPKKKLRLGGAFYDFRELVRTTSDTKTYGKILKKFVSEQKPILLVNVEDGTTEIPETNESDDTEKIGSILHDSVDSDIIVIDDDSDVLEVIGKARGHLPKTSATFLSKRCASGCWGVYQGDRS